jgi:hypothetical protein
LFCCSASRDWAPANKEQRGPLLCTECRAHLKKYGELPPAPPTPPGGRDARESPYMFRPVQSEEAAAAGRMRTRTRGAKELVNIALHSLLLATKYLLILIFIPIEYIN